MLNYRLIGVTCGAAAFIAVLGVTQIQADDRHDRRHEDQQVSSDRDEICYQGRERAALGVTLSEQSNGKGVRIRQVTSDGPADKAGLREGDQITQIDDRAVHSYQDVVRYVNRMKQDQTAKVKVLRDGDEKSFQVDLASRANIYHDGDPQQQRNYALDRSNSRARSNDSNQRAILGVNLEQNDQGDLVIRDVRRDGPADRAGLHRGDQLLKLDDEKVSDRRDVRNELAHHQAGDQINVVYRRDGEKDTAKVRLDTTDDAAMQPRNDQYAAANHSGDRRVIASQGRFGYRRWSINHDHPALGVTLREDDDGYLSIARVVDDSPADEAGLKREDEILSVDDQRVNSVGDVLRTLARRNVGQQVALRIRRDGDERNVDVKLASSDKLYSDARNQSSRNEDDHRAGDNHNRDRQPSNGPDSEQD